jgi:hypothetical protein
VHDPPGLEVSDDLLDYVADLVDVLTEFLLPVEKLAALGLPERRDHLMAYIPLVAYPVSGAKCQEHPGFVQAVAVVTIPVNGIGNPCELPGNRACDLDVHSGGLVLPRVELLVRGP